MNLLALDTATETCSAALITDRRRLERRRMAFRDHARLLVPMIDALLDEAHIRLADLDGLAYGRGPGSFTGLRIAAGLVQGLALALNVRVVPVSVLASLAWRALEQTPADLAYVALDARMGEVYWAVYRRGPRGFPAALGEEMVCPPENVAPASGACSWAAIGSGWSAYEDKLTDQCGSPAEWRVKDNFPHARDMASLALFEWSQGNAITAEDVHPMYLRDQVANKSQS